MMKFGKKIPNPQEPERQSVFLDTERSEGATMLREERLAKLKMPREPTGFQCPYCSYEGITQIDIV